MRRATLLLAALGCALPAAIRAHQAQHPKTAVLRLTPAGISLTVELLLPAGEAARALRASFDRDRDGRLDEREQAALAEHLALTAMLRTRLSVDGAEVALRREGAPRVEQGDAPASSTALLAVRVELRGEWPPGSGDWRGRRALQLRDEAASASGHVPVAVQCQGCALVSSSAGQWLRDEQGREHVAGAQVAPGAPLELLVRTGPSGLSCGR